MTTGTLDMHFIHFKNDVFESKLREAERLHEIEDNVETPYASKYKERDVLLSVLQQLQEFLSADGTLFLNQLLNQAKNPQDLVELEVETVSPQDDYIIDLYALVQFRLGVNYLDTEENASGEQAFRFVLDRLGDKCSLNYSYAQSIITVHNRLGVLWSERNEISKAFHHLSLAEQKYFAIKDKYLSAKDTFGDKGEWSALALSHTLTMFYKAQVHVARGERELGARYCHITLLRQLGTPQLDKTEWALNAMRLCDYYVSQEDWAQAVHCVRAAYAMALQAGEAFSPTRMAELHFALGRLYLARLEKAAADSLRREIAELDGETCTTALVPFVGVPDASNATDSALCVRFDSLVPPSEDAKEIDLFVQHIADYAEAKTLFLTGLQALNTAKLTFVLDGYVTEHVAILQTVSALYRALAQFEHDPGRRAKMHKRRATNLEPVVRELNPAHFADLVRELLFELGETHGTILEIKTDECTTNPSAHAPERINTIAEKATSYFQLYLQTYEENDKEPEVYEEAVVTGVLLAHFHLARLWYKRVPTDLSESIVNHLQCLHHYRWINRYLTQQPDQASRLENAHKFVEEKQICKEMAELVEIKVNRLQQQRQRQSGEPNHPRGEGRVTERFGELHTENPQNSTREKGVQESNASTHQRSGKGPGSGR